MTTYQFTCGDESIILPEHLGQAVLAILGDKVRNREGQMVVSRFSLEEAIIEARKMLRRASRSLEAMGFQTNVDFAITRDSQEYYILGVRVQCDHLVADHPSEVLVDGSRIGEVTANKAGGIYRISDGKKNIPAHKLDLHEALEYLVSEYLANKHKRASHEQQD